MKKNESLRIKAKDGKSFFRVDSQGRVRFIMMPEDRAIFLGQVNYDKQTLFISRKRIVMHDAEYIFSLPGELINALKDTIQFVILHDNDLLKPTIFMTTINHVLLFGQKVTKEGVRHEVIQTVPSKWLKVKSLGEALEQISESLEIESDETSTGDERRLTLVVSKAMDEQWKKRLEILFKKPCCKMTPEEQREILEAVLFHGNKAMQKHMDILTDQILKKSRQSAG